jgi:hypothetical protein
MLVFDKRTGNTNRRKAIFFRGSGESRCHAHPIDQGFCFNAVERNFSQPFEAQASRSCSSIASSDSPQSCACGCPGGDGHNASP